MTTLSEIKARADQLRSNYPNGTQFVEGTPSFDREWLLARVEALTADALERALDLKYFMERCEKLGAALMEAVEWDWQTDPESIPEDVQKLVMGALQ